MHKRVRRKKRKRYLYIWLVVLCMIFVWLFLRREPYVFVYSDMIDQVEIVDDGKISYLYNINAGTVGDLLNEYVSDVSENDRVFPSRDEQIFSRDVIFINREKEVNIIVDGEERTLRTFGDTIASLLELNDIVLDKNDIIVPSADTIIYKDEEVKITRVIFEEEIITKSIPFETVVKKDDELNFLKKYTDQKGQNGSKDMVYRVAYHDGKEVGRELMEERITKESIDEVIVQGTQVKLGKSHTGMCSWYSYTGTLAAANQWLPKGSYVKVTNKANGKSVIVQINDRGPFVPGRIIDLDKVAFQKIASLGAGVIDVKMEEVIQ